MGKKLAPLCGEMRVNFRAQKLHVFDHVKNLQPSAVKCVQISALKNNTLLNTENNLHPSAVKCVQIFGTKNASGQMSLRFTPHRLGNPGCGGGHVAAAVRTK
jgi:hypothetical protein